MPDAQQRTLTSSAALPVLGGKKSSYRERVADALRAALIAGELRAGEVYSAPTLAARFGVSATPVREAMLDLAKDGRHGAQQGLPGHRGLREAARRVHPHPRADRDPHHRAAGHHRGSGLPGGAAPGRPGDRDRGGGR